MHSDSDLDGESAWRDFGGKTLEEAHSFFAEVPESYQEAFMWMEAPAFVFYFPVLDEYLRGINATRKYDFNSAWILAKDIEMHFDCGHELADIPVRVIALCDFVCRHIDWYVCPEDPDADQEKEKILEAYTELRAKAVAHRNGVRPGFVPP